MDGESTECTVAKFRRWGDLSCALLLIGFCSFIFREGLFGGHLLFGSDFVGFYQGVKQFLFDQVHHHGSIPYWNPFVFGGMPFWAHFESTIFYPLDFLFWVMAPEKAFGYTMFIHMVLAALFMYGLLRSLHVGCGGSFAGAVIYVSNGFIMATLYDGQMFRVQAYVWLPLVIHLLNRSLRPGNSCLNAVMAGLFWGFQILSGSPQDALYTLMAAVVFCLLAGWPEKPKVKATGRVASRLALFLAFGLGTAAVQIVPAAEFVGLSVRAVFDSYQQVTRGSYPLQGIITALIPDFFGKYAAGDFWVSNVPWSIPLYNLYAGILPLMLLFFVSPRNRTDRGLIFFAASLAVGALLLAMGSNTPLYRLMYVLPGFDRIRAPAKIIFLYMFAMSLLAGLGMDGLFRLPARSTARRAGVLLMVSVLMILLDGLFQWSKTFLFSFFSPFMLDEMIPGKAAEAAVVIGREFHIITLMGAAVLLVILLWARSILSKWVALILLCALILFDLTYMNWGALRYGDKGYLWAKRVRHSLAQGLGKDKDVFRVGSYPNSMGPNFEMYLGYQTVAGYNPLYLYRYYEYIRAYNPDLLGPGKVSFFYSPKGKTVLMDLLNVKYEISHQQGSISRRKSCLSRVFFVPGGEVVERSRVLDRMVGSHFDPRQKVIFETGVPSLIRPNEGSSSDPAVPALRAEARILSYSPDRITASVYAPAPGYLFFSEVFYPGWKAFVDGRTAPVLRGNYIFRVVPVPKGRHVVRLLFDPVTVKWGIFVSSMTMLFMAVLLFFHLRRKDKGPGR